MTKPAIIIIPGSFSPVNFYLPTLDKLQEYGYEAYVNNLCSASRNPPEDAATMHDDAAFFRRIVEKLADQGKDVVIVTHSYGGIVGTEAAIGVSKAERQSAGKPGGVVRLVYLTSVVPPAGGTGDYMKQVGIEECAKACYSDMSFEEGVFYVKQMPRHSTASFLGELTRATYKDIPVSYIFCEQDRVIPPDVQRSIIERIEKEKEEKIDVRNLKSGHCPNLSRPEETAKVIAEAITQASG